jgi:hypothetical protein
MVTGEKFKVWYEENKENLAQKRKIRYRKDPVYRDKRIQSSKRHYWLNKRRAVPMKKIDVDVSKLLPDEIADVIISNENDVRCGLSVPVPMFYHGSMSKHLRRTVQTLRLWALRGLIPEATYRNHLNYRLYTKDQLKIYLDNIHLLRLVAKDFSKHPFFMAIREGLEKLEPDGIEIMHIDEWRIVDESCAWCRQGFKLEHLKENKWVQVPCFECNNPYDIESRKSVKEQEVRGRCDFCDEYVVKHTHVIKNSVVLVCPTCGRRIADTKVV